MTDHIHTQTDGAVRRPADRTGLIEAAPRTGRPGRECKEERWTR
jgi:hypothetical protein